jgi:hypothetical protein
MMLATSSSVQPKEQYAYAFGATEIYNLTLLLLLLLLLLLFQYTRAVWKVRGLAAMRRCHAEGGGDCYAKL